jgi:hypothetical protein
MAVEVECGADTGVPKPLLCDLWVDIALRGMTVPQIMKSDAWQNPVSSNAPKRPAAEQSSA